MHTPPHSHARASSHIGNPLGIPPSSPLTDVSLLPTTLPSHDTNFESMQIGYQVYAANTEEKRLERAYRAEVRAAYDAEAASQREVALVATLEEQLKANKEQLGRVDARLERARHEVKTLEAERQAVVKGGVEAEQGVAQAQSKIQQLVAEVGRRREQAEVAEHALTAARLRSRESGAMMNPLNHPMVKSLLK